MRWMFHFFAWTILFAVPCYLISSPYQRILAAAVGDLLTLAGRRVEVFQLQVYAPFDLGIFAAMCLASLNAPLAARKRALLLGLPFLVGLEIVTVLAAAGPALIFRGSPDDFPVRLMRYTIETVVWISGPSVWLLFLGAWILPGRVGLRGEQSRTPARH
jgi:hypothetical protein